MLYTSIHFYKTDSQGNIVDDTDDIIALSLVNYAVAPSELEDSEIMDGVFADIAVGTHVRIEGYILEYTGATVYTNEEILERISDEMEEMLENEELVCTDDWVLNVLVRGQNG